MPMSSSKRKLVFSNEEKNKKVSGSVWSEEDEISLLKGMIDYELMNQANPYADLGKFYNFVKASLHFDVQRRQLTDKLWTLKNKFLKSGFDVSKPHHAMLLELAKSIRSWGKHHADESGGESESGDGVSSDDGDGEKDGSVDVDGLLEVVDSIGKGKVGMSDVREGEKDHVVVDDNDDVGVDKSLKMVRNKGKGKIVTRVGWDGENDNVAIDGGVCVDDVEVGKSSKVVKNKGKGKVGIRDARHGKKDDMAVDDGCKFSKMVKNKLKGKFARRDGQEGENDNMGIDGDVYGDKGLEVVKKKRKFVNEDGQNVKEVDAILDDVNGRKSSKVVENKKKGKVVTCDGQTDKGDSVVLEDVVARDDQNVGEDTVVVDDVEVDKSLKMVKSKDKGKIVTRVGDCENGNVALDGDDFHANKGLKVVKKKRKFVDGDGQNVKEDDVNGRKSSKVVENKKKGKVVICDGQSDKGDAVVVKDAVARDDQNVGVDTVVVDEVLASKNVPGEVNKKDLKYFTSMYPELSKVLELETLSRMPQQIRKNCVMDTINSMGREKVNKLEKKWADLHLMELELHAEKFKQINLILEAVRR